jgi:hypothetical protein
VTTRLLPTATPSLVKISSGLGNSVNVIQADIPYDGGIIHVIDKYEPFLLKTSPRSLVKR